MHFIKNNFIVLLEIIFLIKLSSTLQMTSIIALPIPKIFILSFFCNNRFFSIWVASSTYFTTYPITISGFTIFSAIKYYLEMKFRPVFWKILSNLFQFELHYFHLLSPNVVQVCEYEHQQQKPVSKTLGHHYTCCFMSYTRQFFKFFIRFRYFTFVFSNICFDIK